MSDDAESAAAAWLNAVFGGGGPHAEHSWQQVGRCVYCGPCGVQLYQGTIPKDHPVYVPPRKPSEADKMRERWGK